MGLSGVQSFLAIVLDINKKSSYQMSLFFLSNSLLLGDQGGEGRVSFVVFWAMVDRGVLVSPQEQARFSCHFLINEQ